MARAAVQAYLLLALAGCSPVVDAKFSDVVVTRPDVAIPAAPTAGLTSVTFSFSMDSSKLGASSNPAAQNQIASAKLHEISLTAKGGITDLSFIKPFTPSPTCRSGDLAPRRKTRWKSRITSEAAPSPWVRC